MLTDYARTSQAYSAYCNYANALTELDYFDFPSSAIAFSESLPTSHLASCDDMVWFRRRNNVLTLLSYSCDGKALHDILSDLSHQGYTIKTLNYAHKDFAELKLKYYGMEYYVCNDWCVNAMLSGKRSKDANMYRRALKHGDVEFELIDVMGIDDVMDVFNQWALAAQLRHSMVVKRHYVRYIERYFDYPNNVRLVGFRRKCDGLLYGVIGYEVFNGCAQLTLAKHIIGLSYFPKYMWITALDCMLSEDGVSKAFCGTTADDLKCRLGMHNVKSYKLEASNWMC